MAYDVCMQSDEEIKAQKMAPKECVQKAFQQTKIFEYFNTFKTFKLLTIAFICNIMMRNIIALCKGVTSLLH